MRLLITIASLLVLALLIYLGTFAAGRQTGTTGDTNSSAERRSGPGPGSAAGLSGKSGPRAEREAADGAPDFTELQNVVRTMKDYPTGFDGHTTATLQPGQSVLTGGYLDGEGAWIFVLMTPLRRAPSDATSLEIRTAKFALDTNEMRHTGLDRLVAGRAREEKEAGIWGLDTPEALLSLLHEESVGSSRILMEPAREGSVELTTAAGTDSVGIIVMPQENGGFEIESIWRHRFAGAARKRPVAPGN
ncbi:hypothetical protein OJ996_21905 [Luteolibacter sp. GHJ8]|uniref:Uncharacterized protein n=1 Tax=Luteolibacter rhizosphaerae TaxID=2989719 RepID=A0ABT3G9T3_9BACT|nr:hypothetical protein [Luteolibacter rhizosphaerae]MCW1916261.1 hypothetical protein [Luteolibacter rhizosphaerae]